MGKSEVGSGASAPTAAEAAHGASSSATTRKDGWLPAPPAPPPFLQRLCCCCCPTTGQPHGGGEVTARVWCGASSPGFVYPEQRAGAPKEGAAAAVCMAGGGVRAATCALGYLRGLQTAGVMEHYVTHLVTNSGASWCSIPYSFQAQCSTDAFLGPVLPPEELSLSSAREDGSREGGFAATISRARILRAYCCGVTKDAAAFDCCRERDAMHVRAWSRAIGEAFLEPHGLGGPEAGYCVGGAERRTKEATGCANVHAWRGGERPFPVCVACAQPKMDRFHSRPLEFTPMYTAVPASFVARTHFGRHEVTLGGVCVEPYGINGEPKPEAVQALRDGASARESVEVALRSEWTVPLEQVAGVSSGFIAQTMIDSQREGLWECLGNDELCLWSPTDGATAEFPVGDGGGCDNLGILGALRRGATRIVACYNFSRPFVLPSADTKQMSGSRSRQESEDEVVRAYAGDAGFRLFCRHYTSFARLWGASLAVPNWGKVSRALRPWAQKTKMQLKDFNDHCQVFSSNSFRPFVGEIEDRAARGEPIIVRRKFDVLPNASVGVPGGHAVELLFIAVSDVAKWRQSLPPETSAWLSANYGTAKQGVFPYLNTMQLKYEPELASLLSQLATWVIGEASRDIEDLFQPYQELVQRAL
mmetsp:Transcript_4505/g.18101  ORF Transcript_4505/g.18101 Transcript_4505/m.18101 type:complete len:646 (-) Transcript_4505:1053-2990(-)